MSKVNMLTMKNKDIMFECRKCEHLLYVTPDNENWVEKLVDYDCPNCGEESGRLWIFVGFGSFADYEGPKI